MEKFKKAVNKIAGKDQPDTPYTYSTNPVSITLGCLRVLQRIAGMTTGVVAEKLRSKALDEAGNIYEKAFIEEREQTPNIYPDVIVPDMSSVSLSIPATELQVRFNNGAQVAMLLEIRERLQTKDFVHWKKSSREILVAAIDKVL
jgi:hypothetical protein